MQSRSQHEAPARWHGWALLVPAALVAFALVRAPSPAPPPDATAVQTARIARVARRHEPAMRRRALKRFPADPWSQADEFAHTEAKHVRRLARRMGVRPGAVLRAIDADVRAHPHLPGRPPAERGDVPPCMPRVYYH